MSEFLFDIGEMSPRDFHESQSQCEEALKVLRCRPLTKKSFEQDWHKNGCRLAPAIEVLRNGWGFEIAGKGTVRDPYFLLDRKQWPTRVLATECMKEAYYNSQHWTDCRERRWEHDKYRCVLCVSGCYEEIQCHHVTYRHLFSESLDELMTVCVSHHKLIHSASRLKFPTGVPVWVAERLLGVATFKFEEWLQP